MPMNLLRIVALACFALAIFAAISLAARVALAPLPRLGHRGAQRRRALEQRGLFWLAEPLVRFIAALVSLIPLGSLRARKDLELCRAGYCLGLTADEYLGLSAISGVTLGGIAWGLTKLTEQGTLLVLPAFVLGLFLPTAQVQGVIRKRATEVTRRLPHAIEIAAMCMGAGLDFPGSLRLLAQARADIDDPLAGEFALILEELELGHTRRAALLNFAERVPSLAVRDFVNAVVQAEQKGNPLARVLQVQGRMLNLRRSVAAEQAATRAGVLMIAPAVLLLGCILLLLMGPFVVNGIGF